MGAADIWVQLSVSRLPRIGGSHRCLFTGRLLLVNGRLLLFMGRLPPVTGRALAIVDCLSPGFFSPSVFFLKTSLRGRQSRLGLKLLGTGLCSVSARSTARPSLATSSASSWR